MILACFVFIRNIYPLSVALKIQKRKWKLDKSNITYLIQNKSSSQSKS